MHDKHLPSAYITKVLDNFVKILNRPAVFQIDFLYDLTHRSGYFLILWAEFVCRLPENGQRCNLSSLD
jgi:hypothetical protein